MHFAYLLRSLSRPNKTYVGMTEDVESRLKAHNEGQKNLIGSRLAKARKTKGLQDASVAERWRNKLK